jgi:hypothetical protein
MSDSLNLGFLAPSIRPAVHGVLSRWSGAQCESDWSKVVAGSHPESEVTASANSCLRVKPGPRLASAKQLPFYSGDGPANERNT